MAAILPTGSWSASVFDVLILKYLQVQPFHRRNGVLFMDEPLFNVYAPHNFSSSATFDAKVSE